MSEHAELRALLDAATERPWDEWHMDDGRLEIFVPNGTMSAETVLDFKDRYDCEECIRPSDADARLIVAAVNALPALLDRLERAEAERDQTLARLAEEWEERAKTLGECTGPNCAGCQLGAAASRLRALIPADAAEERERGE